MRTTLKQTLAGAWMLLAALALSTAGCSQLEDAPDTGNRTGIATGNEPISISIAPKPGFEAGDAETRSGDADTRSTVDGSGNFVWQDGTDMIFAVLTFDDHQTNPTVLYQRWIRGGINTFIVNGWTVRANWTTTAVLTSMNWPVGASKCTVQAFTTNCSHKTLTNDGLADFTYKDGEGDHMFFTGDFTVGTPLAIAFKHSTTRVTFAGLKASTKYRLLVNGVEPTFATSFKKEGFALADATTQTFTTGAGITTFTICLPLTPAAVADATIGIAAGEVKLTLLKVNADGTTTTPVNEAILKATGSAPNWVMNGNRYTVNVKEYAGGIDPDTDGNLLPTPPPVVTNGDVYEVNGYYVTAAASPLAWTVATVDNTNPCKVADNGWRIPTMKDFEAMAGWSVSNKWDASKPNTTPVAIGAGTDVAAFNKAFPVSVYSYYSSESRDTDNAWTLLISNTNSGVPTYNYLTKTIIGNVRCVQRKP